MTKRFHVSKETQAFLFGVLYFMFVIGVIYMLQAQRVKTLQAQRGAQMTSLIDVAAPSPDSKVIKETIVLSKAQIFSVRNITLPAGTQLILTLVNAERSPPAPLGILFPQLGKSSVLEGGTTVTIDLGVFPNPGQFTYVPALYTGPGFETVEGSIIVE